MRNIFVILVSLLALPALTAVSAFGAANSPLILESGDLEIYVAVGEISWCSGDVCGKSSNCEVPEDVHASPIGPAAERACIYGDGAPQVIEEIAFEREEVADLPSCNWRPAWGGGTACILMCGEKIAASCWRSATDTVYCGTSGGSSATGSGTIPCEVQV